MLGGSCYIFGWTSLFKPDLYHFRHRNCVAYNSASSHARTFKCFIEADVDFELLLRGIENVASRLHFPFLNNSIWHQTYVSLFSQLFTSYFTTFFLLTFIYLKMLLSMIHLCWYCTHIYFYTHKLCLKYTVSKLSVRSSVSLSQNFIYFWNLYVLLFQKSWK